MKRLIPLAVTAVLCAANPILAAEEAATTAPSTTAETTEFDQQMSKMQELMNTMQEQMRKIEATQDESERQKLLTEHWDSMQQGMGMMRGMWHSDRMGAAAPGMSPEQMTQHQRMMSRYMGMQQMMMQHMWGHQGWMMMGPQGKMHGHMMGHHMKDMWQ